MRLAFISPFGFTPKATLSHRILPLAASFKEKGYDVIIVVPPYTNPEASGTVKNQGGVELINIVLPGKFLFSLRVGLRLARQVKKFNPERVYIFKPKGYSALAGILLWISGNRFPLFLDVDDLESDRGMEKRMGYKSWMRGFFRYEERWLVKRVAAITAASRYLAEFYGRKIGKEKVYYLPNGSGDCFEIARNEGERLLRDLGAQGKRVVLLYTRFTECSTKDIVDFIRLFSKRYPQGMLLVIGEGYRGEREEIKAELEKEGLSDFASFTGWIKREELGNYLSLGEAAIYPLSDTAFNRAKCSAKLLELMAMGKAVVASPVGEVPNYIKDGESGMLAKGIEEMVEKVIGLLENREKAKAIGEGARYFLYENFNWDRLVSSLLEKSSLSTFLQ